MAEFNTATSSYLKYSTVAGYFLQDDPDTDPDKFDFVRLDSMLWADQWFGLKKNGGPKLANLPSLGFYQLWAYRSNLRHEFTSRQWQ